MSNINNIKNANNMNYMNNVGGAGGVGSIGCVGGASKTSIKDNLISFYNAEAGLRDASVKSDWKIRIRDEFLGLAKREEKRTLLEIGAGAGQDSLFFMNAGLRVTAADLSAEMVKKCREKAIDAHELDYYNITSLGKTFDCVWAINTLLHVPKGDLPGVLEGIGAVLNEGGLFYMGLYGGDDVETEYVKSDVSDTPRFYALHSEKFLRSALEKIFSIIKFETIDVDKNTEMRIFHSITLRKA